MNIDLLAALTGHLCQIDSAGECLAEGHAHAALYASAWKHGQGDSVDTFGAILDGGVTVLPDSARPCALDSECGHTACILAWVCDATYQRTTARQWQDANPELAAALDEVIERV